MSFYSEDNFLPDLSVGYLAKRVHQLSGVRLEPIFQEAGLSYQQWSALATIMLGRGSTCLVLSRELCHDAGATTRLVDGLEERGLVRRERRADDRRVIDLAVTPAGEEVALACRRAVIDRWNGWLADWPAGEIEQLLALLNRLRVTLEQDA